MKVVIHRAKSRGHTDRDGVNSWYTFSYSEYFNPERVHFGALRILNEETIAPGQKGLGPHERHNMEIVYLPLEGELEHRDSLGNRQILRKGQLQLVSTGTGVRHSEDNKNRDKPVRFLKIWIIPDQKDTEPRYQLIDTEKLLIPDRLNPIVVPCPGTEQQACICRRAWFSQGKLGAGAEAAYAMKSPDSYGVYLFVIAGEVSIDDDIELLPSDGMGISEAPSFRLRALTDAEMLLIEVPKLK